MELQVQSIYEEVQLLSSHNPKLVCLQETFLKDTNQLNIKNYQHYNYINKDGNRASRKI